MGADGLGTVFTPSLEGMKHVKSDHGEMLTKPFLDVCKLILPVIGPFCISSLQYGGCPPHYQTKSFTSLFGITLKKKKNPDKNKFS